MTIEEANKWKEKGIEIIDYNSCYIGNKIEIGSGTVIYPNVSIRGNTVIGKDNIIDSNTVIIDCSIGDGNKILSSYLTETKMGNNNVIGPFAHTREEVLIGNNNKIGNYVELKKTRIGNKNFCNHLSYIGNAVIGNEVNFSGGAITANYNLIKKEYVETIIDDGAIIGANSILVAPIKINKRAFVAAGSVMTDDVPERALGIARCRQEVKKEYMREK